MKFKHTFHVFVDNFSTTYKLLIYRLIVIVLTAGLCCAVIIPTLNNILSTAQYEALNNSFSELWADIVSLNVENLHDRSEALGEAFNSFKHLLSDKSWLVGVAAACLAVVYLINRFFIGIGNYVTGALVNDKMALHANSSFTMTLVKNLKNAVLYSLIYAPIACVYDFICLLIIWAVISVGLKSVTAVLIKIFLVAVLFVVFSTIKFTFTADWLPSLIHAKMNNRKAIVYTFSRKGKNTANVFSNALVTKLIVIALNVAALFFTLGAGLLLTLPGAGLIQICFGFVNYFDANRLKFFTDEYTVVGPKKEAPVSREEFFKGDE